MGPEVELLKDHRQVRANAQHLFWIGGDAGKTTAFPLHRFAIEQDIALLAVFQQVCTAQDGGFARSRAADQADNVALMR